MNVPIFEHNGAPHRIVGQTRRDPDGAFNEARYNLLQQRVPGLRGLLFGRWRTVIAERVPDHVRISLGCFGDTGGWRSQLPAAGFAR